MFRKIALLLGVVGIMLSHNPAFGSIIYVSGDESGTWSADTVIVTGEVRVPPDSTLVIEPGTKVYFWTYCKFIVDDNATLLAIGTAADSILFDEHWLWPTNGWHGLRFQSASSNSRLEYCHLTNGVATGSGEDANGGAIYCSSSGPLIQNCLIDSCSTIMEGFGGGIYCNSSDASISGNTISGNYAEYGGGISCISNSSPTISGNTISGNAAGNGGGIYCNGSSPGISGNSINGNLTASDGGGISCVSNSSPMISGNTIGGNSAFEGGGICCWYSNPTISNNTISGNSADVGGGIGCLFSSPSISGNTISGNSATNGGGIGCVESSPGISGNTISGNSATNGGGVGFYSASAAAFELNEITENSASSSGGGIYLNNTSFTMNKNTLAENTADTGGGLYATTSSPQVINGILWGNSPEQIFQTAGSNVQVTYSDHQGVWPGTGNINADPLFVNAGAGNFLLQAGSPCIDSGDPDPIYNDPNGSRADMGCYYYGFVGVSEPELRELPKEFALMPCFPNPFNAATVLSYELPHAGFVKLEIFDVNGRRVSGSGTTPTTALVDGWRPAGRHKVTFDGSGLASGVYVYRLEAGEFEASGKMVLLK